MRLNGLIAVPLLVAGCSHATVREPEPTSAGPSTTISSGAPSASAPSSTGPTSAPPSPSKPGAAPPAGAPIADVIAWIEAGRAVDAAGYHTATRDGVTTDVGDDVAFTIPGDGRRSTLCMTDHDHQVGTLTCLVDLVKPPPQPENVYGQWRGGWVDFDGTTLQIGSAHGDPGPFARGDGPELPAGAALSFGDFRCRAAGTAAFCVNYAHRSAVRLGPDGIDTFGCLRPVPPQEDGGQRFSC